MVSIQKRGLEIARQRRIDRRYTAASMSIVIVTGVLLVLGLVRLLAPAPPKPLTTIPFGAIFQPQPDQSWMRSI
jgi:hypothetical protein